MLPIKDYYNNRRGVAVTILQRYLTWLPDKVFVKLMFRIKMGYKLNLRHPTTFNEKLQWLKLYDRNPDYSMMVDKYAVKKYVESLIGKEYIIPTIGVWNSPEDIGWDSLPDKFVLKTTHGGGNTGVVICKDKSSLDKEKAIEKLNSSLKQDIYKTLREWPYKNVPRRIIAEQYIENGSNDLPDYKFFCFDGRVEALFVGTERGSGDVKFDFFDSDFNHLDLVQTHPMSGHVIEKPENYDVMKEIASVLSKGIPHVRIDLYNVNGKIFFGEMTFYHHGGVVPFHPASWDYTFGKWISLPNKEN